MAKAFKKALPAALTASFANQSVAAQQGEEIHRVPIQRLKPNPFQPRRVFAPETLGELAENIRINGILQPLVARLETDGSYTLIAGERRLRAAELAGQSEVPVVVRPCSNEKLLHLALAENLHRDNLHAVDELVAFRQLVTTCGSQQEAATLLGLHPSTLSGILRPEALGEEILNLCARIPQVSRKFLRGLLEMPAKDRMAAVRQALPQPDQPATPRKAKPVRSGLSGNSFKFVGRTADQKQFQVLVKYLKQEVSTVDIENALIGTLVETVRQNHPELKKAESGAIEGAIRAVFVKLSKKQG